MLNNKAALYNLSNPHSGLMVRTYQAVIRSRDGTERNVPINATSAIKAKDKAVKTAEAQNGFFRFLTLEGKLVS